MLSLSRLFLVVYIGLATPIYGLHPSVTLGQIVSDSDRITIGQVTSISTGHIEEVIISHEGTKGRFIYTLVTITPTEHLKGVPVSSLIVKVPGGQIGDRVTFVPDEPEFRKGEEVLLFLGEEPPRPGQQGQLFSVIYGSQGKFHIEGVGNNKEATRSDHRPNTLLGVSFREGSIPLGRLREAIQAEMNNSR